MVSDHQIFLEDNRAPVMQRKFKQAAAEYGPSQIQNMLEVLWSGNEQQDG